MSNQVEPAKGAVLCGADTVRRLKTGGPERHSRSERLIECLGIVGMDRSA
jgi:hypothetical protein